MTQEQIITNNLNINNKILIKKESLTIMITTQHKYDNIKLVNIFTVLTT